MVILWSMRYTGRFIHPVSGKSGMYTAQVCCCCTALCTSVACARRCRLEEVETIGLSRKCGWRLARSSGKTMDGAIFSISEMLCADKYEMPFVGRDLHLVDCRAELKESHCPSWSLLCETSVVSGSVDILREVHKMESRISGSTLNFKADTLFHRILYSIFCNGRRSDLQSPCFPHD